MTGLSVVLFSLGDVSVLPSFDVVGILMLLFTLGTDSIAMNMQVNCTIGYRAILSNV